MNAISRPAGRDRRAPSMALDVASQGDAGPRRGRRRRARPAPVFGRGAAPRLVPRPERRAGAARLEPRPARLVLAHPAEAGQGAYPARISRADAPAPRLARSLPASSPLDEIAFDGDDLFGGGPATGSSSRPAPASPIALASGRSWRVLCPVVVVAVGGLAGRGARGPVGTRWPDGSRCAD